MVPFCAKEKSNLVDLRLIFFVYALFPNPILILIRCFCLIMFFSHKNRTKTNARCFATSSPSLTLFHWRIYLSCAVQRTLLVVCASIFRPQKINGFAFVLPASIGAFFVPGRLRGRAVSFLENLAKFARKRRCEFPRLMCELASNGRELCERRNLVDWNGDALILIFAFNCVWQIL